MNWRDPAYYVPWGCIALWLLGVWVLGDILDRAGSMYPMLSEHVSNPRYDPELHELMVNVGLGWTAVCILLLAFWWRGHRQ